MQSFGRSRPSTGDLAVALAVGLVALALSGADALSSALVVLAAFALAWWRAWPVAAITGTGAALLLITAYGYEPGVIPWAPWIALYSCMASGTVRERITGGILAAVEVAGYLLLTEDEEVMLLAPGVVMSTLLAALAGEAVRSRRAYATELEETRELAARHVLLEERARLARELHDSLGHAVNVIVMQAGVARRVFDSNPGYGREALQSIEETGRDALVELDSLLDLLRPDGDPPATVPGPALAELPTVIQRVRDTGRAVEVMIGDLEHVPPRVSRAAFRIAQEAMTNATRHAGPGRIIVEVVTGPKHLRLDVRDEGGECGPIVAGRGLVNMAERSRMVGGTFEAGPVPGGFLVRTTLPLTEGGAA